MDFNGGFTDHEAIVSRLNKVNKSWTAKVPDHLKGLSFKEIGDMYGLKKENKIKKSKENILSNDHNILLKTYVVEDVSDLPSEFSWEEVL